MARFTFSENSGRARFGALGRVGCALLLLGFLAHAGDGLMAALCHPGMEDSTPSGVTVHVELAPDRQGAQHAEAGDVEGRHDHSGPNHSHDPTDPHDPGQQQGPDHDPTSHDDPCPFGGASIAVCGGVATAASPLISAAPIPSTGQTSVLIDPDDSAGALLALKAFRPPRA